ncbi:MAG TPA: hypothetical protein VGT61_07320 [Thermomicrobiales bacterium]|jgi:hypothetical protein|nr:hypothetical protein [Thermomicrobiales bacterium]
MSVGSDASVVDPGSEGTSPEVEYELPIIPADQARDELGPLIDAVRWSPERMAEVERLLKGYVHEDGQENRPSAG